MVMGGVLLGKKVELRWDSTFPIKGGGGGQWGRGNERRSLRKKRGLTDSQGISGEILRRKNSIYNQAPFLDDLKSSTRHARGNQCRGLEE